MDTYLALWTSIDILSLLTLDLNVPTAEWLKGLPMDASSKPLSLVIKGLTKGQYAQKVRQQYIYVFF